MTPDKIKLPKTKRLFDICVSVFLFLLFTPFLVVFFVLTIIEYIFVPTSRGPIVYREMRISNGNEFLFTKFRIFKQSAISNAQGRGKIVHTKSLEQNSKNLTIIGRILKRIYMDELPQLWHVLRGEMTLVGPRPTNFENTEKLRERGDFTKDMMICGLTGPFQAVKGNEEEARAQKDVDMEYIEFVRNSSGWRVFLKDVRLLVRTVKTILEAKGI